MSRVRGLLGRLRDRRWRRHWWLLLPALLGLLALLPVSGSVLLFPGPTPPALVALPKGESGHVLVLAGEGSSPSWPRMRIAPEAPEPGGVATLWLTDRVPWAHMRLTVDGRPARYEPPPRRPEEGAIEPLWTWEWTFTVPEDGQAELAFFHDCHRGCVERGRLQWQSGGSGSEGVATAPPARAPTPRPELLPTELGLVFPHPERDWHGRAGWAVELSYAREPEAPYWGIDDLAGRVWAHRAKGLRVLVRVDYDRQQSFPPVDSQVALAEYLAHARRLAADARLAGVHAFFYGSGFNTREANGLAGPAWVTPAWYARVFNGAGADPRATDNLVDAVRAVDPEARLLVGPVRPFARDQSGRPAWSPDAPWLSYFHALVHQLDAGAAAKAALGRPARPDGFALHVAGQPEALPALGLDPAREPGLSWWLGPDGRPLLEPEADGAAPRGGFGVYADWLAIVNARPTTRGLPAYVTAVNTFVPEAGRTPAEGYPAGWLREALAVALAEPQIAALCWFVDGIPGDAQWEAFQLTEPRGRSRAAAEDFASLLEQVGVDPEGGS